MKTDTQLQSDILAELKWEPSVHASQIGVAVVDGFVTLSGRVSTYLERCNAQCAAHRVSGVRALVVEVEVKPTPLCQRSDPDIARAAENALDWMKSPLKAGAKVQVESGWVTLSGSVSWNHQKQAAADCIRYLVGVTGVSNQITITPRATLTDASAEIEAALMRHAHRGHHGIRVQVDGRVVTLLGSVDDQAERRSALHAAWSMPGVCEVVDQLVLAC